MTDTPTGRRRIDRVLAPGFVADLAALDDDELRSRRADVQAEEQDVSYVRRLLQGRLDVLRGEQTARRTGDTSTAPSTQHDEELVAALARILADTPRTGGPADVRYTDAAAPQVADRRRQAEAAVSDVRISDPASLDDDELADVIGRLESLEHALSTTRRELFSVLDALRVEVERRVADGLLPAEEADTTAG
ncbi:MAG: aerial mycelium formation protein [Actinomycetes bacterium]